MDYKREAEKLCNDSKVASLILQYIFLYIDQQIKNHIEVIKLKQNDNVVDGEFVELSSKEI